MENPPEYYVPDFIEVSSKLFHRSVAEAQVEQDKRKKKFMKDLVAWANYHAMRGEKREAVSQACQVYIDRAQKQLREELEQVMAAQDLEKMKRDYGIQEFGAQESSSDSKTGNGVPVGLHLPEVR